MESAFTTLDTVVFLVALVGVMAIGLYAGRKEDTAEDYFLAGRTVRWWGVAGSIFGSNVSANHLVGFVGAGFAFGFAHSHFELGAIAGLMLLCYGLLPVYRKLRLYTLSEYLGRRYNDGTRLIYALMMILVMVVFQMVAGFYIGSRSMQVLLEGTPLELSYSWGVMALAVVAAAYTIQGGLKAVIWTDVIQSLLLLAAAITVALLVFSQPEVGGWSGMMAIDSALPHAERKMRLYLETSHEELPWTGVLSGLLVAHFFYWGTNQFIVQRALSARSDAEGRRGIVAAGFLKLLIPFFSIATGVAAFYMLDERLGDHGIVQDVVFAELIRLVVSPLGFGLVGLIAAGLIGAILSSIDSMMNSAATIVTFDLYKRYVEPEASDRRLIWVGRLSIIVFMMLAAVMAITVIDPESEKNFFLVIVDQQSHVTPGLLVVFLLGVFWRRATGTGALVAIVAGPIFSVGLHLVYRHLLSGYESIAAVFGSELNTFHRLAVATVASAFVHVAVSLASSIDPEKSRLGWSELVGHDPRLLSRYGARLLATLGFYVVMAVSMVAEFITPPAAGFLAAAWTLGIIVRGTREARARQRDSASDTSDKQEVEAGRGAALAEPVAPGPLAEPVAPGPLLADDRLWAGVLCSLAIFMMFYFY